MRPSTPVTGETRMAKDRLAQLTEEARALLDKATGEKRDLDAAEEKVWQELYSEICELRGMESMTPLSGDGWHISSSPRWPHAYLEAEAAYVTRECFPWGTADPW